MDEVTYNEAQMANVAVVPEREEGQAVPQKRRSASCCSRDGYCGKLRATARDMGSNVCQCICECLTENCCTRCCQSIMNKPCGESCAGWSMFVFLMLYMLGICQWWQPACELVSEPFLASQSLCSACHVQCVFSLSCFRGGLCLHGVCLCGCRLY
jgi:hypothetical protein